jgi:hypothetical protein
MLVRHDMGFCVDSTVLALRTVFYPKYKGEFTVIQHKSGIGILDPYNGKDTIVWIECYPELGNDVLLTPYAPYENRDEVEAFEEVLAVEAREFEAQLAKVWQ